MRNFKMFYVIFISMIAFAFVCSCSKDEGKKENVNVLTENRNSNFSSQVDSLMLSKNFKLIHDKYSIMICDSIQIWRLNGKLNSTIYSNVWEMIISGLVDNMDLNRSEIINLSNSIDMLKENFSDFKPKSWITTLPTQWQSFYNDVTFSIRNDEELTYESINLILEAKRIYWRNLLNPSLVDKSIDIAKSSYVHWLNNFDCLLDNDNIELRARDPKRTAAAISLAEDDLLGAGWGAMFGGLGGALLGAVGGTLAGTIKYAIHGCCP
jgi:hypothetical protein